jgi:hypothetical protein
MEITSRCLNDVLGYCRQNRTGTVVSSPTGVVTYTGFGVVCNEDWQNCKDHVKFTDIVKPDAPKMEEPQPVAKKKAKKEIING